jgi:aryl-alcohol dehydrogenase-like predicted oxidoreductase
MEGVRPFGYHEACESGASFMHNNNIDRRTFLAAAAAAGIGALGAAGARAAGEPPHDTPSAAPAARGRDSATLGRTGRELFRCGFGGYPLCELGSDDEAIKVVHGALERRVRYFDTAPSYGAGVSERRIGLALRSYREGGAVLRRDTLFVATKTLKRDADGARRELDESLTRLQLDYVDSVQCHEVHDDVESLFGRGAVLEGLETARDEGLVKHIGITGHRNPKWLIEAVRRYPFATALVPINPFETHNRSFVREFLPVAVERGVAVVAMKVYGGGFLLNVKTDDGKPAFTVGDLLGYALSHKGVAVAVPGCREVAHVDAALAAARDHATTPPAPQRLAELEALAARSRVLSTSGTRASEPRQALPVFVTIKR